MHRHSQQKPASSGVRRTAAGLGAWAQPEQVDKVLSDGPSLHSLSLGLGSSSLPLQEFHVSFLLQESTLRKLRVCLEQMLFGSPSEWLLRYQ